MDIVNTIKVWGRSEWIYYYYSKIKTSMQKYIDVTFEATKILDNLWLGSITSSCNREALHENKIETIISAILGSTASFPFDFNYDRAKLRDVQDEDILCDIKRLLPIIHNEINNERGVLIHCIHGKSRSTTIVAAYLIKYKNMTTDEALEFIKNKRSQIDPNPGYIRQLREFEDEIRDERMKEEKLEELD
jgi:Dual specificity phosphatase, catalytic domain